MYYLFFALCGIFSIDYILPSYHDVQGALLLKKYQQYRRLNGSKVELFIDQEDPTYYSAVVSNKVELFNHLIDHQYPGITFRNSRQETLLHNAISSQRTEMFHRLLATDQIDCNAQAYDGQTAAHYAVFHKNIPALVALRDRGASLNKQDMDGTTPLSLAVRYDQREIVDLLLSAGVDVTIPNNDGLQALHCAKSSYVVRRLIAYGANVQAKDRFGHTPAAMAVLHNYPQSLAQLLQQGSSVDYVDDQGNNLLHIVRHPNSAKLLLDAGVSVTARNQYGQTPLHTVAVQGRHPKIVKHFIAAGALVNARDDQDQTPLHDVAHIPTAKALIDHGASLDATNDTDRVPLAALMLLPFYNKQLWADVPAYVDARGGKFHHSIVPKDLQKTTRRVLTDIIGHHVGSGQKDFVWFAKEKRQALHAQSKKDATVCKRSKIEEID